MVPLRVTYNYNKFFKQPLAFQETKIVAKACPICGGDIKPFTSLGHCAGAEILVRSVCNACAFVTFSRMLNGEWFENFYKSD